MSNERQQSFEVVLSELPTTERHGVKSTIISKQLGITLLYLM